MLWKEHWKEKDYIERKLQNFKRLDTALGFEPKKILDIGCGFAYESEYFQKKYGSELYLLDSEKVNPWKREVNYGPVSNMGYYNSVQELHRSWKSRNMVFEFIDSANIQKVPGLLADNIFDLILSSLSCGFHYPADTYKDLVKRTSDDNTKVIFDIRKGTNQQGFSIVRVIHTDVKYDTVELKFL